MKITGLTLGSSAGTIETVILRKLFPKSDKSKAGIFQFLTVEVFCRKKYS